MTYVKADPKTTKNEIYTGIGLELRDVIDKAVGKFLRKQEIDLHIDRGCVVAVTRNGGYYYRMPYDKFFAYVNVGDKELPRLLEAAHRAHRRIYGKPFVYEGSAGSRRKK
jgi:hypothetical protein